MPSSRQFACPWMNDVPAETEKTLKTYRALAVTAGVVILGFGVARLLGDPGTSDPFWERCLVSAACFAFALSTRFSGTVRVGAGRRGRDATCRWRLAGHGLGRCADRARGSRLGWRMTPC